MTQEPSRSAGIASLAHARLPDSKFTMMDPAVKTALAACVLLAGFCAASLLREDRPTLSPAAEPLSLRARRSLPPQRAKAKNVRKPFCPPPAPQDDRSQATVLVPSARRESPPPLTQERRRTVAGDLSTRLHRVVDGDSLPALAQRYLGSSRWAMAIFEANRDVLLDPDLLPIGLDLKIPPRPSDAEAPGDEPTRPLVPVPRPSFAGPRHP